MPTCSRGWTIQTKSTGTWRPDPEKAAASASSHSAQLGKTRRALCHEEAHLLGFRELSGNAVTYVGECRPRGKAPGEEVGGCGAGRAGRAGGSPSRGLQETLC